MTPIQSQTSANRLTWLLLFVYLLVLTWIILLKFGVEFAYRDAQNINLLPFPELWSSGGKLDKSQVILNMFIFVPFGLYLQVLYPKNSLGKNLLLCFLLSFLLESSQYLLRFGALDSTDLITNSVGGLLGIGVALAFQTWAKNPLRVQQALNLVASLGTALMVVLLVLLKLDLLPIRYR